MLKRQLTLVFAFALVAGALAQRGYVAPADAHENAVKLNSEIKWHDSLDAALAKARKENKLVFYMHMLGKMDAET